jgi:hypothetical protein
MAKPLDRSDQPLRSETWKEISDIVDRVRQLKLGGMTKALMVDHNIKPNLPTSGECLREISASMRQPMSPSLKEALRARIDHLRQRVLFTYTESISQMASVKALTGRDDADVQREHTQSVEIWFRQAIQELLAAVTSAPTVRTSVYLSSSLDY